jgi:hypothetical protein
MPAPKCLLFSLLAGLVGCGIGIGISSSHYARLATESEVGISAVGSESFLGLVSLIDSGKPDKARQFLETTLVQDLQLLQAHSSDRGEQGRLAHEGLKRAAAWRERHPGLTLSPSLDQELQKARAVVSK